MTRYLLDTDAIVDFFKGFRPTVDLIEESVRSGDRLCTCDVVVAEVYTGLAPGERERGEEFFSALRFLPTSREAARQAGLWRHAYARRGRQLPTTDCLIAAVAHDHRIAIITGNARDYPMPEVEIRPLARGRAGDG